LKKKEQFAIKYSVPKPLKTPLMQKKNFCLLLLVFVFPLLLNSQSLAADINKSKVGSNPGFVRAGLNHLVFTASNDKYGRELFVSNGQENSVNLAKDLTPGNASTLFLDVSVIDSACFFVTSTNAETTELWYTNLSNPNPKLLKTNTGGGGFLIGQNGNLIKLGDQFFFLLRNAAAISELWKTDGTVAGTLRVFAFNRNVFPSKLGVYKNQLIFLAENSAGLNQLWKSDGTSTGTALIKSVDTQNGIFEYAVYKDSIYFVANDGISGWEMWRSDATAEGTQLFVDLIPGNGSGSPSNLKVAGKILFFSAFDAANGSELWCTEGTIQSTQMLKDLRPGTASSAPYNLKSVNNTLFFLANDGVNGVELWKSDGTARGTQLVKDIFPGSESAFKFVSFQSVSTDSYFYFVANDGLQGKGLWRSDGTLAGTLRLKDVVLGPNVSGPTELMALKNDVCR
jgi:ELWxxDGT repeat protein